MPVNAMETNMSELKKCPFCGGEPKIDGYVYITIKCRKCRIQSAPRPRDEAIAAWNRRANSE
ncbi:Lar family restriction alleviation protein [Providencia manganoxydans]|uniref:Lar family restriction alleviation protein n=1 Tax=Providencia manganoxydans TaxID=2923283 RepID=UPI0034DCED2D